jgi:Rieske Fe-S protein
MSDERSRTEQPSRRGFLQRALLTVAALGAGIPALIAAVGAPLRRGGQKAARFVGLARKDELAAGFPRAFPVVAEKVDAWERREHVPLGQAWLLKHPDQSVTAFSAECPHAGCAVDFDGKQFVCPCHDSTFALDGSRLKGPAPRGLDPLEVREQDGVVQVRFCRFRLNQKEREELS